MGEEGGGGATSAGPQSSNIKKHRLLLPLEMDIEHIPRSVLLPRNQRLPPALVHDLVEHEIPRVRLGFVVKIKPRLQPDIDAARHDPQRHMRRHEPSVRPRYAPRF